MAQASLKSGRPHAVDYTEAMFEESLTLFPDNVFLVVSYAAFIEHYRDDIFRVMGLLQAAQRMSCSLGM